MKRAFPFLLLLVFISVNAQHADRHPLASPDFNNASFSSFEKAVSPTVNVAAGDNIAPVANAGSPVSISLPVSSVTLNGTASYDPDGSIVQYYWYQTEGPVTASISNFSATPAITGLTVAGRYGFGLQVKDNSGVNAWSSVLVTVSPAAGGQAPACVINTAPANAAVLSSATVATLSWPAAANAVSYDIYLAEGNAIPTVLLANSTALSYQATGLKAATLYSWYVSPRNASAVNAGCGANNRTTFTTAAAGAANVAPVANAGAPVTINLPTSSVTLDGTASSDPDGQIVQYYWYQTEGPVTATISNFSARPVITGLTTAGKYGFGLQVKDNNGVNAYATVVVTVNPLGSATPPACVTNNSPANGAVLASQTSVTLSWPASANASTGTSYDVYFGVGSGIPTRLYEGNTYSPMLINGLTAGTTYSWYVAPRNAGGPNTTCAVANTTTFTTAPPTIGIPSCVTNISPANGVTVTSVSTAKLSWSKAAYADGYDLFLFDGTEGADSMYNRYDTTTYLLQSLKPGTTYRWYIVPRNATGRATGCAASATTFTTAPANTLPACAGNLLPASGTVLPTQRSARVSWSAVAGATSYDLSFTGGGRFNTTELSYYVTDLVPGATYSWAVSPRNANGSNYNCTMPTFTTAVASNGANLPPVANAGSNTTITLPVSMIQLYGGNSYDADGRIAAFQWYPVQTPITTSIINATSVSPIVTGLTTAGTYIYGLQVKDENGLLSNSQVTIIVMPAGSSIVPACVSNLAPANGATLTTQNTVTLSWSSSPNATSYDIYLSAGIGAPTALIANTTELTYFVNGGLTANTTYSWYIAPKNGNSANTSCASSNTSSFTTSSDPLWPACVSGQLPVNGTLLPTQTSVRLSWSASADAASYDIWLSAGSGAPAALIANTSALTYYATGLTPATLYNWYIIPRNSYTNGANTVCASNKLSFTTASATGGNLAPVASAGSNTSITLPASSVNLNASASYDPDGYITQYYWYPVQTPVSTTIADAFALQPAITGLTVAGNYIYGLQVKDNNGLTAYAQVTITVNPVPTAAPACSSNLSPANGAILTTQTSATLRWAESATADSYNVYLSAGNGTSPTLLVNTNMPYYTAEQLQSNTTYTWYIAPRNAGGVATGCETRTSSFTTAIFTPSCTMNRSPLNGMVLPTQTSARLTWYVHGGASSYDVYLAAGDAVPAVLVANTTDITYYATGLQPGTLYSWYIAPRNVNGPGVNCGQTSRATFRTANASTGSNQAPIANAGADIAISTGTSINLSATDSYDPDGNIVQFYWYQTEGPVATTIANPFSVKSGVSGFNTAGVYGFGLQVRDNSGVNAWTAVRIYVSASGTRVVNADNGLQTAPAAAAVITSDALAAAPVFSAILAPNPVKPGQQARLLINSHTAARASLRIISSTGSIIHTQQVVLTAGTNTTSIDTRSLSQGLYLVHITRGNISISVKLLVE